MMNWTECWASRTQVMKASMIRELLKLTSRPEVISFAGGLPATETLPIDAIAEACDRILRTKAATALQYGPTEGYTCLREHLAAMYRSRGVPAAAENLLITTGSQQGLDLVGRTLIDTDTPILTEAPTYIGALQAWRTFRPVFITLPLDDDGMQIELFDPRQPIRFAYVLPNFQNPAGVSLSRERRQKVVELAHEHNFIIVEDDPYRALRYDGEDLPALVELEAEMLGADWDRDGRVIHLGTFSKVMAPGLRVGWLLAPSAAIKMLVLAKQGADLHSAMLSQCIADDLLVNGTMDANMPRLIAIYRKRRDTMLQTLNESMSDYGRWTQPHGGLFIWLTVYDVNTPELLQKAMAEDVAFVPGNSFYPDERGLDAMRLNFSCMPPERIAEGIRRLGRLVMREFVVREELLPVW